MRSNHHPLMTGHNRDRVSMYSDRKAGMKASRVIYPKWPAKKVGSEGDEDGFECKYINK